MPIIGWFNVRKTGTYRSPHLKDFWETLWELIQDGVSKLQLGTWALPQPVLTLRPLPQQLGALLWLLPSPLPLPSALRIHWALCETDSHCTGSKLSKGFFFSFKSNSTMKYYLLSLDFLYCFLKFFFLHYFLGLFLKFLFIYC